MILNEFLRGLVDENLSSFLDPIEVEDVVTPLEALNGAWGNGVDKNLSLEDALTILGTAELAVMELLGALPTVDFGIVLRHGVHRTTEEHRENLSRFLKESCPILVLRGEPDYEAIGKLSMVASTAAMFVLSRVKDIPSGDPEYRVASEICSLCLKTQTLGR